MLWAVTVGADLQVHLGDIIATVTCAFVVWLATRVYRLIAGFFSGLHDRVEQHDGRLGDVEQMVDQHSHALVKWEPLEGPIARLYQQRRRSDHAAVNNEVIR